MVLYLPCHGVGGFGVLAWSTVGTIGIALDKKRIFIRLRGVNPGGVSETIKEIKWNLQRLPKREGGKANLNRGESQKSETYQNLLHVKGDDRDARVPGKMTKDANGTTKHRSGKDQQCLILEGGTGVSRGKRSPRTSTKQNRKTEKVANSDQTGGRSGGGGKGR